jgi:hypothetical protein
MTTILFVISIFYCVYLNIRLKDLEDDMNMCNYDRTELEVKIYNKMMEIRKEIKDSIKPKKIEKSRRRSTKRRSRIPKA